jgi:hypothetical protein
MMQEDTFAHTFDTNTVATHSRTHRIAFKQQINNPCNSGPDDRLYVHTEIGEDSLYAMQTVLLVHSRFVHPHPPRVEMVCRTVHARTVRVRCLLSCIVCEMCFVVGLFLLY